MKLYWYPNVDMEVTSNFCSEVINSKKILKKPANDCMIRTEEKILSCKDMNQQHWLRLVTHRYKIPWDHFTFYLKYWLIWNQKAKYYLKIKLEKLVHCTPAKYTPAYEKNGLRTSGLNLAHKGPCIIIIIIIIIIFNNNNNNVLVKAVL